MNLQELENELTTKPKQIYLIQSNQMYLLEQVRKKLKQVISPEEQAMNYASYDMDEVDLEVALADATAVPFFGDKRVVVIEKPLFLTGDSKKQRTNHNLDALIEYLKHPEPTTVLAFLVSYDKLDKRKKVVKELINNAQFIDLLNLSEKDIQNYILTDSKKNGFTIEKNALQTLFQRTNADLTIMMQEMAKLYLYCYQNKIISANDVNDLVTKSLTENVFDLVNMVLAKKTRSAVSLYHELRVNGEESLKMNALLISQFRLLIQVKGLLAKVRNEKELATQLKVHPYRVKLANQISRKFNINDLSNAYLGLFNLEKQLKSTTQDPEMLFELFMIKFANN